ncbi:MAG: class I poly(R)-hydroxyalkanoic acid synthase [Pseudomonadota bacterium]
MSPSKKSSDSNAEVRLPDAEAMAERWQKIAEQSQRLIQDFIDRQADGASLPNASVDPVGLTRAFADLAVEMARTPQKLLEQQARFMQSYIELWQVTTQRMAGQEAAPVVEPARGDRRFKDSEWQENPYFDHLKQSYLLASRFMLDTVRDVDGLETHTADKVDFYVRQFVDAMAPTNFAATNPTVLRETVESGGENLVRGLSNVLDDLERGKGKLRIKMTDLDKFKLGENVAVTPGSVVFENDLMQLLQFNPTTDTVHRRPLLILPPWINKYYILDLRESNSFIKWAVDQGHTVFVVSWVNPDERLSEKSFDDYMVEGPLAALDAIEQATGEANVKAIGYCLGGTLLAATLAYMNKVGDNRIKAATFFTTMTDFTSPGELGVFVDEEQLAMIESQMADQGYLDGAAMADVFNMLRANDLIWSFVVNNYLMGKDPFPFDLLYWNSDSTRMPRVMHSYYLRKMYQQNLLIEPGGIEMLGEPVDLRDIKTPVYILSTKEDHIAPWKSTYSATQLYSGNTRFVLGASGHIAGVVNPPSANKYGYWVGKEMPASPDDWFAAADYTEGSWWTDWRKWVSRYNGGKKVAARNPGDRELAVLEAAPGSYVKVQV